MSCYYFNKVAGYKFNLLERCKTEIGVKPTACHDTDNETVLMFECELSEKQLAQLALLMNSNPCLPPKSKTVFRIEDIGEKIEEFNKRCGVEFKLYCSGDNKLDFLELHADEDLTPEQIEKVKGEYQNLIQCSFGTK